MQRVTVEELELVSEECKELIRQLQVTQTQTQIKVLFEKIEIMRGFSADMCLDELMQRGNYGLEMLHECIQSIDGYLDTGIDMFKILEDVEVNKKYFT